MIRMILRSNVKFIRKKCVVINELMSAIGGETRTGATRQVYATLGTPKIALDMESKAHEP